MICWCVVTPVCCGFVFMFPVSLSMFGKQAQAPTPTSAPVVRGSDSTWYFTKQDLGSVMQELRNLLGNSNDRALRSGVERIVTRGAWPWTELAFRDDFTKGANEGGLDWRVINGEYAIPGQLLCPTNPAQHCQTLAPERFGYQESSRASARSDVFRTYTKAEFEDLYRRGFNTNYAQSWHMGYTRMKNPWLDRTRDKKDPANTLGPLRDSIISGKANPARVVLFGDGATESNETIEFLGERVAVTKSTTDGHATARALHAGPNGRFRDRRPGDPCLALALRHDLKATGADPLCRWRQPRRTRVLP